MKSISLLIPCLNEKKTITKAIDQIYYEGKKYFPEFEVIVADNGSTDGTLEKLIKIQTKGFKLINIPIKGYGAALHYGILSAKYPWVLFADADLSYNFNNIKKFLPFIDSKYDLVLGSRLRGKITRGAMPSINRYFGTPILTMLIRVIYGIKTSDCNSGMRLIKKGFYKKLGMKNRGMEWASELLIKTAIHKGKYAEVPITFSKDQRGKTPHLNRWTDGWRHLKAIILLKPSLLLFSSMGFFILGILEIPNSIFNFLALSLISELFFFCFLATKKLEAAIEGAPNLVSSKLEKFPLVLAGIAITILGLVQLFLISDSHLFIKYFFLSQVILFDIWLFFVETIDTHIKNRLP